MASIRPNSGFYARGSTDGDYPEWPSSKNEGGDSGEFRWSISERQMQSHLNEARTADGVLQSAEIALRRANISPGAGNAGGEARKTIYRRGREERIEIDIVTRDIETWVIKDVESDNVIFQRPFFVELEILRHTEIEAVLERGAENVAASWGVGSLIKIANTRDGIARGHSTRARSNRRADSTRGG